MNHYQKWEIDSTYPSTLSLRSAALTHPGQRRVSNWDAVFEHSTQAESGESVGLYVVCDGYREKI